MSQVEAESAAAAAAAAATGSDINLDWEQNFLLVGLTNITNTFVLHTKAYLRDVVEHLILCYVLYVLLCLLLYACIVRWKKLTFNRDITDARRVLFVVSHPDDECMFFGPSLLNFCRRSDCEVFLLCLSTGDYYGVGKLRKKELYDACTVLNVPHSNVSIINHTLLQDDLYAKWPSDVVSNIILQHIEMYNIDTLITFDKHGITNHPNHCSAYLGVAYLVLEKKLPNYCKVYTLETVNYFRAYWLLLDLPVCFFMSRIRYVISLEDRRLIHRAMDAHKSQLEWYRYRIYMVFSRYMFINTLQQMDLIDIELDLEIDD